MTVFVSNMLDSLMFGLNRIYYKMVPEDAMMVAMVTWYHKL